MKTEEMLAGLMLVARTVTITSGSGRVVTVTVENSTTKLTGYGHEVTDEDAMRAAIYDVWRQFDAIARLNIGIALDEK